MKHEPRQKMGAMGDWRYWWRQGPALAVAAFGNYPLQMLTLLALAVVLPFVLGVLPTVRFASERIDVHVYPGEVRIDGSYVYRNPFPFPVRQGFSIPFPVDEEHPQPTEIVVTRLTPNLESLPLHRRFGTTVFEADFAAGEESEIRVQYRQSAGGDHATYILTTTQPWRRPLEHGVYILYPHETLIVTSNYPFNLPEGRSGFQRDTFMPEHDWQFSWRKTHAAKP